MDSHDLGCLAVGITTYLNSKYFTELAPGTQAMRRRLLSNVSGASPEIPEVRKTFFQADPKHGDEARNEIPSEPPAPSEPPTRSWSRRPARRRGWSTA
jgi:hypothetical protein